MDIEAEVQVCIGFGVQGTPIVSFQSGFDKASENGPGEPSQEESKQEDADPSTQVESPVAPSESDTD